MNDDKLVTLLKKEFGFWDITARAFVDAKGKCVYCDTELYGNRINYYSMERDHLLPQHKYPNFANHQRNNVISCRRCNNFKRTSDILGKNEEPEFMLNNKREELIKRVRNELKEVIESDQALIKKLNERLWK